MCSFKYGMIVFYRPEHEKLHKYCVPLIWGCNGLVNAHSLSILYFKGLLVKLRGPDEMLFYCLFV